MACRRPHIYDVSMARMQAEGWRNISQLNDNINPVKNDNLDNENDNIDLTDANNIRNDIMN